MEMRWIVGVIVLYFIDEMFQLKGLFKRHHAEIMQLEILVLSIIVFTFCINDKE